MKVTVYSLPNCVQCDSTKRVLERGDVEFDSVDLSQDESAMKMIKDLGYSAAPVVIAGDTHWSGFRMDKIQTIIKKIDAERGQNGRVNNA